MEKTLGDIVQDVKKETDIHVQAHSRTMKSILSQVAGIISIAAIAGAVLQYLYNTGYYSVYGVSKECIVINLQKYLKFSSTLYLVLQSVPPYHALNKKNTVTGKTGFDMARFTMGLSIFVAIFLCLNLLTTLPLWMVATALLLASGLLEFVNVRKKNIDSLLNQKVTRWQEKKTKGRLVEDRMWLTYSPAWIGLIVILLLLTPLYGKLQAKKKTEYQMFSKNDETYAVVLDINDRVIAEKASIEDDVITIDSEYYVFFDKDGIAFTNKTYESVILHSK